MTTTLLPLTAQYLNGRRGLPGFCPGTERHYSRALRTLDANFGRRPLAHLTPRAIERWLASTERLSDGTRRLYRQDVRHFCQWLVREGFIGRNPVDEVPRVKKPTRVPRALTGHQVSALLAVAPDERAVAILRLMVDLGLRCCEVASARMAAYDPAAAELVVIGKGGNERKLPVLSATTAALARYFATRETLGGALISSRATPGGHLTALYLSTMVAGWAKAAGIKAHRFDGVGAHALRHTAASDVLAHCGDLQAVKEMLGHQSLDSTLIYLRSVAASRLREAMEGRLYDAA